MSGLARRSGIGWHERNTIIHGLAEDGRVLTHQLCIHIKIIIGMNVVDNLNSV